MKENLLDVNTSTHVRTTQSLLTISSLQLYYSEFFNSDKINTNCHLANLDWQGR